MRTLIVADAAEAGRLRSARSTGQVGRRIVAGEDAAAPGLTSHGHPGGEVVRAGPADAAGGGATIAIAVKNVALIVDGDFSEVEQVAVLRAAALLPDAGGVLHGIVRRDVDGRPGRTAIKGAGDEGVPFAGKAKGLVIPRRIGTEETDCRAPITATNCFDLGGVNDAVSRAKVKGTSP